MLRLLFVSGEASGGAPRSTLELAGRLSRKHDVSLILGDRQATPLGYGPLIKAAIKLGPLGDLTVRRGAQRLGQRAETASDGGVRIVRTAIAANRARREIAQQKPDVVIANSLPRVEMRWLHEHVRSAGIPFVIYLREEHAVTHFSVTGLRPDLALANSEALADQVSRFYPCTYIPSVVDVSSALVETTRQDVLCVNPALDSSALDIARLCPEVRFLVQESWPLESRFEAQLLAAIEALPNVRFRRLVPGPRELFATAKLLLITAEAGRPRIVVEAQANGIPVLGPDLPSLREVVGKGGVLFPPSSTATAVAAVIRHACLPPMYESLCDAAREHAESASRDPETVTRRFEDALTSALEKRTR